MLVLRRRPFLARHRENAWLSTGDLLARLLDLHQPSVHSGRKPSVMQLRVNVVVAVR